jgi:hypothetical protein
MTWRYKELVKLREQRRFKVGAKALHTSALSS